MEMKRHGDGPTDSRRMDQIEQRFGSRGRHLSLGRSVITERERERDASHESLVREQMDISTTV
jgi:tartrate dehydratase beta subunit/fumarate hydratase class I family protein